MVAEVYTPQSAAEQIEQHDNVKTHDVAEHLYERRPRCFMADCDSDGPDDVMALFKEELELAIERGGGTHCAADAFELHGITVPERAKMFGTLSSRQSRKTDKGMDPRVKPCPTICCKEEAIVLVLPCGREIVIPSEVLHWIRTQGGDFPFEFSPTDDDKLRHRILGMGVSTIVGAALRRALESDNSAVRTAAELAAGASVNARICPCPMHTSPVLCHRVPIF